MSDGPGDATEVAQLRAQLRQLVAEAAENDRKLQRTDCRTQPSAQNAFNKPE